MTDMQASDRTHLVNGMNVKICYHFAHGLLCKGWSEIAARRN